MDDEHERRGFHLEKSVSIGHIITTLSIAVSMIWWASSVETRLAVHTTELAVASTAQDKADANINSYRLEVREQLNLISAKLDRIVENRYDSPGGKKSY